MNTFTKVPTIDLTYRVLKPKKVYYPDYERLLSFYSENPDLLIKQSLNTSY